MVLNRYHDAPAALVRAAALQLGDHALVDRYREEWLASLPTRDRYGRWRYALSLLLRGAWASRRSTCGPRAPIAWSRRLPLVVVAFGILGQITFIAAWSYTQLWAPAWAVACYYVSWYLLAGGLVAACLPNRTSRQIVLLGALVGLLHHWIGDSYLVFGPQPFNGSGFPDFNGLSNQFTDIAGVAVLSACMAIVCAWKTPRATRLLVSLAMLLTGAEQVNGWYYHMFGPSHSYMEANFQLPWSQLLSVANASGHWSFVGAEAEVALQVALELAVATGLAVLMARMAIVLWSVIRVSTGQGMRDGR